MARPPVVAAACLAAAFVPMMTSAAETAALQRLLPGASYVGAGTSSGQRYPGQVRSFTSDGGCDTRLSIRYEAAEFGLVTWDSQRFRKVTGVRQSGSNVELSWTNSGPSMIMLPGAEAAAAVAFELENVRRTCAGQPLLPPPAGAPQKPKVEKFFHAEATVRCHDFPAGPQKGLTVSCGRGGNGLGGYASDKAFLATVPDCAGRFIGTSNAEGSGVRYYGCGYGYGGARTRADAFKLYPSFLPSRRIYVCDKPQQRCATPE